MPATFEMVRLSSPAVLCVTTDCPPISAMIPLASCVACVFLATASQVPSSLSFGFPNPLCGFLLTENRAYFRLDDPALMTRALLFASEVIQRKCPGGTLCAAPPAASRIPLFIAGILISSPSSSLHPYEPNDTYPHSSARQSALALCDASATEPPTIRTPPYESLKGWNTPSL